MAGFWKENEQWADLFLEDCGNKNLGPTIGEYAQWLNEMLSHFVSVTDARENLVEVWKRDTRWQREVVRYHSQKEGS